MRATPGAAAATLSERACLRTGAMRFGLATLMIAAAALMGGEDLRTMAALAVRSRVLMPRAVGLGCRGPRWHVYCYAGSINAQQL